MTVVEDQLIVVWLVESRCQLTKGGRRESANFLFCYLDISDALENITFLSFKTIENKINNGFCSSVRIWITVFAKMLCKNALQKFINMTFALLLSGKF